ncbi:MAG: UDP-3-O-acyl-N-acetylglucosamine deacetylase [Pelosinus sp.]|nr:UDP-3-O-acyl-N-acetylglucosamine deacetylase [Pelosinus sp.]
MQNQMTIANRVKYTGVGLHSGKDVNIILNPASEDTGIVFIRTDLPGNPRVRACASNVTNTMRATTLEEGAAKVFTVEHLLAAFFALGVDNCLVEIDSVEPPVADGSALSFVRLIQEAKLQEQQIAKKYKEIQKEYIVRAEDRFIAILPYDGLRITFTSINPHPALGVQFGDYEITPEVFMKEIAPARTIGFMNEIEALKAQGLGLGGTLEAVVVYDDTKALNPLRFTDELVRHKILDIIGDLALGGCIRGHVIAVKSGHALNTALAKKVLLGN